MQRNLIAALICPIAFMATILPGKAQTVFYDALDYVTGGRGGWETSAPYSRIPASIEAEARPEIVGLGKNSSGLYARFRTDSRSISARWNLTGNTVMDHMSFTGIKGLDLYRLNDNGEWQFVNTGRPQDKETTRTIISNLDGKLSEYMLYLPLYDGVERLEIGLDEGAVFEKPLTPSPARDSRIVFYGTSITQGACASRPGMAYSAILSRHYHADAINLGFSGNGKLDREIARAIAEIEGVKLIVLDFVPNCTVEEIEQKSIAFHSIIREAHPGIPIIYVENPCYPHSLFDNSIKEYLPAKNRALHRVFDLIRQQGDTGTYYLESQKLIGSDHEATVDGIHFTDLGFYRWSRQFIEFVESNGLW